MLHEDLERSPRQRRHAATLDRIVEAAGALVAEGGVEALSMGRLADAVDFTAGALYRYFPSKDAVLSALVARHLGEALGFLSSSEAALPRGAGPLARVAAQNARPPAELKVKLMIGRPPCCCSKVALESSRSSPPTTTRFSTGRHCGW